MADDPRPKTPTDIWVGGEYGRHLAKLRGERADLLAALQALVAHIDTCDSDDCTCDQGPAFALAMEELQRTR